MPAFRPEDLLDPLYGLGYQFYSGIGSDIGELAIVGGLITIVRHHNCHAKGCPRIGRHVVEGTPYKTCRKHHPAVPDKGVTVAQIEQAHREALDLREAHHRGVV